MYGWSRIVFGIVVVILGFRPLFDPSATMIWVGAFVLGPFVIYRGIRALKEDAETAERQARPALPGPSVPLADDDVRSPHAKPIDAPAPLGIGEISLKESSTRVHVVCEGCAERYVYFPEATEAALAQYQVIRHCAAPCPRCGWIQRDMIDWKGEFNTGPHWSDRCLTPGLLLALASAAFLAYNLNRFYGALADRVPNDPTYWFANLAVFLGSVVCVAAFLFGFYRRPNPNNAHLSKRLEKGRLLGMPLAEFETLVNAERCNTPSSAQKSTGIQEVRGSPGEARGSGVE